MKSVRAIAVVVIVEMIVVISHMRSSWRKKSQRVLQQLLTLIMR